MKMHLVSLVLAVALCLGLISAQANERPLAVAVSILPEKYFVERIGGSHVDVTVLVGPGQSPATYEPTPRQMAGLGQAKIYFRIGVAFEDAWMGRIRSANPAMRVVDLRRGIRLRAMERPGGPVGEDGMKDPHVWTSPPLVKLMVGHICDALITADPAHAADYEAGCRAFRADLDQLDATIRATLASVASRRFMVFHPSWGYFADSYGLQQIPIEVEGKEPGARSLNRIITEARQDRIKVIFVQPQFSRRTAEVVARAIGARVVEADPLAENYVDNLRKVAQAFAAAMERS